MNASDALRDALNAVTAAMNTAVTLAKDEHQFEQRDQLIVARDSWVRTANRVCNHGGPRGRLTCPPIVPADFSLKPPVRAGHTQARRPVHLHMVEPEPLSAVLERMEADADRNLRVSRALIEQCRNEREVPDAG